MTQYEKILNRVLRGTSDTSISFSDLCYLLDALNFDQRIRGSHHIFSRQGVAEILNLQPKGANAKPYQVKQVRNVILKYKLGGE
ncbi:MAG: type II toxin-antitoxin system HicA family toxin [Chloroflexi bacterium]|nr:type II toxin-antitoxin system HicA family toxin [Chloroflexota bacterium]